MAITYPASADTTAKKLAYMLRVKKRWTRLFNVMGNWYTTGIAQTTYDKLPLRVRDKIAYTPQLTKAQWDNIVPRLHRLRKSFYAELFLQLDTLANDTTYNPDPTDAAGTF